MRNGLAVFQMRMGQAGAVDMRILLVAQFSLPETKLLLFYWHRELLLPYVYHQKCAEKVGMSVFPRVLAMTSDIDVVAVFAGVLRAYCSYFISLKFPCR